MTKTKTKTIVRTQTWGEFLDVVESPCDRPVTQNRDSWAGCSHDKAVKLARGVGYQDALPDAEAVSGAVEKQVAVDRFQTTFEAVWDIAGSEVDLGRYLAGEPENMIDSVPLRIAKQGRAVRIAVNVSASSGTDEAVIRRRGAAVVALCDILARAQHPLEIWAVQPITPIRGGSGRYVCSTLVQAANEPLDTGRVMFALAHPAYLRRLVFRFEDHETDATILSDYGIGTGYGAPAKIQPEVDLPDQASNTIVLQGLSHGERGWNIEYAVRWIEEQLDCIFGD